VPLGPHFHQADNLWGCVDVREPYDAYISRFVDNLLLLEINRERAVVDL